MEGILAEEVDEEMEGMASGRCARGVMDWNEEDVQRQGDL